MAGPGWVKFHREIMDKPIWFESTPEQIKILITLLLMASHKETEWEWKGEKYKIQPGQFITSLPSIVKKAGKGISIQNVRTALKRFEKYDFLTDESTKQNRLITILNWASYQRKDDENEEDELVAQQTSQQSPNRRLTAIKNLRTKESNKKKRPKATPSDIDYENSELLFELILQNFPNTKKPKDFEKWANEFRLLRDVDGNLQKDVKYIIKWSQESLFWKSNIRSADKFRKQYPTLYLQAEAEYKKKVVHIDTKKQDLDAMIEKFERQEEQGAIEE